MSSAPAITIAIPYYAGRDYLREAIDSVLAQTRDDWELVVVDDCGPQPAEDVVASYADQRIRYVRNQHNLGLAANWNECVRQARAPWVTLLHGDDRLKPDYVARVLAAAESASADTSVVFTDAEIIDESGRPTTTAADLAKSLLRGRGGDHDVFGDAGMASLMRGNYIVCPTMCLRVELVGGSPFSTSWRFVPDWEFTVAQLLAGHRLRSLRTPLLQYRRHSASQTSILTEDASRFVEEFAFLKAQRQAALARGWSRSATAAQRRVTTRVHLALLVVMSLVRGRFSGARAKTRLLVGDLRGH